ncbi:MAG: endonuclease III, partial [Nitrospirae bacterium]
LIYPVGFYRTKAKRLKEIARVLLENHNGRVPEDMDSLLKLPGVGRKTANIVLSLGYGRDAIAVDGHVHRITNRWALVRTKTPEQTEVALKSIIPRKYWKRLNSLLVGFGQGICKPLSPLCSKCNLEGICPKTGVTRHR